MFIIQSTITDPTAQLQFRGISITFDTFAESTGALFGIALFAYGYRFVAKGTVGTFVGDMQHEATVYERLHTLQGLHIPVFLGQVSLEHPYYYDHGVRILHMVFLSWAGDTPGAADMETIQQKQRAELLESVFATQAPGVIHRDIRLSNACWNEEIGKVTLIDSKRSVVVEKPPEVTQYLPGGPAALGHSPSNQRKLERSIGGR
ncbi:hypothetical protein IQ07DRAFT_636069 [Pyrenochaeta sp. DS3sAY3a]|nr:hypothetical protein IQ07DRAFT_636069 [Pyrenochaeta sp. DS3sAY3a]